MFGFCNNLLLLLFELPIHLSAHINVCLLFCCPCLFLLMNLYVPLTLAYNLVCSLSCLIDLLNNLSPQFVNSKLWFCLPCLLPFLTNQFDCTTISDLLQPFCEQLLQQQVSGEELHHHRLRRASSPFHRILARHLVDQVIPSTNCPLHQFSSSRCPLVPGCSTLPLRFLN